MDRNQHTPQTIEDNFMNLFEFNANTGLPQFDPIVAEIKAFKNVVNKDKSKDKSTAKAEIAFIWFYSDPKSDFYGIPDDKIKVAEILNIVDLPKGWTISKEVAKAIEFYSKMIRTTTVILLEKMRKTINKLSDHLEEINFSETDDSGKLKYDMKKVVDTASQIPRLLTTLKEIEDRVKEEQTALEKKIRGKKELSVWEDGIDGLE